jgi:RNA polymerase sigma factor (sigma-70 family)
MITVRPYQEHEKEEHGISIEEGKIIFSEAGRLKRIIFAYLVSMPGFIGTLAGYENDLRNGIMKPGSVIAGKSPKDEKKNENQEEAVGLLQKVRQLEERHSGKWLNAMRILVLYKSNLKMSIYANFIIELNNRTNHASRLDKSSREYKTQIDSLANDTGLGYNQLHTSIKEINRNWELFRDKQVYVTERNRALCESIIKKYLYRGVDKSDLMQEAKLGIMSAFERFDYRRGLKFSTLAYPWIRQAVRSAVAGQGRHIRVPMGVFELMNNIDVAEKEISLYIGKKPTVEQISQFMKMPVKVIKPVMMLMQQKVFSLDELLMPDNPESARRGDLIADQRAVPPPVYAQNQALRESLEDGLKKLGPLNELIMKMRYGLYDGKEWGHKEIGKEIGMTKQAVSQREKASLRKLRRPSTGMKLRSFTNNHVS